MTAGMGKGVSKGRGWGGRRVRKGQNRNSKHTQNTCFCPKPVEQSISYSSSLVRLRGCLNLETWRLLRSPLPCSGRNAGFRGRPWPAAWHLPESSLGSRRAAGGCGYARAGGPATPGAPPRAPGMGHQRPNLPSPGVAIARTTSKGKRRRQQVEGQAEGRGGGLREGRTPAQRHERAEQRGLRAQERAARLQLQPLGRRRRVPGWLLLDGGAALLRLASIAAVGVRVVLGLRAGLSPLDDRHAAGDALGTGGGCSPSAAGRAPRAPAWGHLWRQKLGSHGVQVADELCAARFPGRPALKAREVLQDFFGAGLKPRVERIQVGLDRRFQRALPIL